ncbi:hypothetical protein A0H81_05611 [Grifola frondosa]|uniref:Uncharacterized protein n=1 Tax=Grifola frondosa TaxID=5627 RepID=A0A1C7MCQ4_GRIFR|nr:hypothetical protein A0H81_05611 [Grifola frondosa]
MPVLICQNSIARHSPTVTASGHFHSRPGPRLLSAALSCPLDPSPCFHPAPSSLPRALSQLRHSPCLFSSQAMTNFSHQAQPCPRSVFCLKYGALTSAEYHARIALSVLYMHDSTLPHSNTHLLALKSAPPLHSNALFESSSALPNTSLAHHTPGPGSHPLEAPQNGNSGFEPSDSLLAPSPRTRSRAGHKTGQGHSIGVSLLHHTFFRGRLSTPFLLLVPVQRGVAAALPCSRPKLSST